MTQTMSNFSNIASAGEISRQVKEIQENDEETKKAV